MNDICCIGHITLDKIITPKQTVYMPGGTSYYFSHGICHLKDHAHYKLVTSLASSEYQSVNELRAKGINVEVIPSRYTVYFENKYGENQNNRTQRVLAKADPFTVEKLKHLEARFFHLGSLLSDDFPLEVIKFMSAKGILSVDAQGYLREVRGETGSSDYDEAVHLLHEWGVKEVLLTLGSEGSLIYAENKLYRIPAYPPKEVVDATGCGDTYMLGYLYMRNKGASYAEAGTFVAALSTIKLEKSGPFCGTEQMASDIIKRSPLKAERLTSVADMLQLQ